MWFREQGIELEKEPQKEIAIPRNQKAAQHIPPKVTTFLLSVLVASVRMG